MVENEMILRLNLRPEIVKKPRWKRKKLVVLRLKKKLERILKAEKIILNPKISEYVHSTSKPPMKFTLKIVKEDNVAKVDLLE